MKTIFFLLLTTINLTLMAQKPTIGIAEDLGYDSLLYATGYRYITVSTSKYFSPKNVSDEMFEKNLNMIKSSKMKLYSCNLFIPGELKVVGRDVDEKSILAYTNIVLQRCQAAGVKMITWGSGGSRRLPDGFDKLKAKEQFISIARKITAQAEGYKIVLALENLNSTETNFITSLEEALEVVRIVDQPNFRLCVDIYHMLKENEPPAIIEKTKEYLAHCEIAEREKRSPPGTYGEDLTGYLKALKKINYKGMIFLECNWENLATQAAPAKKYLQKKIDEVYAQK